MKSLVGVCSLSHMATTVYDVELLQMDMALNGWSPLELSRRAGVSGPTVYRYLSGECRTAKTTHKLATALGYPVRRYVKIPRRLRSVA
jgi:transcriptional regulator with XRE-family HTH domain